MKKSVTCEVYNEVLLITLDRPKANAIDATTSHALGDASTEPVAGSFRELFAKDRLDILEHRAILVEIELLLRRIEEQDRAIRITSDEVSRCVDTRSERVEGLLIAAGWEIRHIEVERELVE